MKTLYNKQGNTCTADDDQVAAMEYAGWSIEAPKGKPESDEPVKAEVAVDPAPVVEDEESEADTEEDAEEDTQEDTPPAVKPRKIPKRKAIKKKE